MIEPRLKTDTKIKEDLQANTNKSGSMIEPRLKIDTKVKEGMKKLKEDASKEQKLRQILHNDTNFNKKIQYFNDHSSRKVHKSYNENAEFIKPFIQTKEKSSKHQKPRPTVKKHLNKSQNSIDRNLRIKSQEIPSDILNIINDTSSVFKGENNAKWENNPKYKKIILTPKEDINNFKTWKSEHSINIKSRSSYKSDSEFKIDPEKKQDLNLSFNKIYKKKLLDNKALKDNRENTSIFYKCNSKPYASVDIPNLSIEDPYKDTYSNLYSTKKRVITPLNSSKLSKKNINLSSKFTKNNATTKKNNPLDKKDAKPRQSMSSQIFSDTIQKQSLADNYSRDEQRSNFPTNNDEKYSSYYITPRQDGKKRHEDIISEKLNRIMFGSKINLIALDEKQSVTKVRNSKSDFRNKSFKSKKSQGNSFIKKCDNSNTNQSSIKSCSKDKISNLNISSINRRLKHSEINTKKNISLSNLTFSPKFKKSSQNDNMFLLNIKNIDPNVTRDKMSNLVSFKDKYFSFEKEINLDHTPRTDTRGMVKDVDSDKLSKSLSENSKNENFQSKRSYLRKNFELLDLSPFFESFKTKEITTNKFKETRLEIKLLREILNKYSLEKLENETVLKNIEQKSKNIYERNTMCNILEDHVKVRTHKLNNFIVTMLKPFLENSQNKFEQSNVYDSYSIHQEISSASKNHTKLLEVNCSDV